jgi:prolyl oligopeptidase
MLTIGRVGALLLACLTVAAGPPPAQTDDYTETLFGTTIKDSYHWMEAGGTVFDGWLTAEGGYARNLLDAIPGRTHLLSEIRRLDSTEARVDGAALAGRGLVYSIVRPEDSFSKIFVRQGAKDADRILIDPSEFNVGESKAQIDYWSVSPDGQFIAYGVSLGGREAGTLRIRRIGTGNDLAEKIDRTRYAGPSWIDNSSFLYTRLPTSPPGESQRLTGGQLLLHRLGHDPSTDVVVFDHNSVPGMDASAPFFFHGLVDPNSSTIVGEYDAGLGSGPQAVYVASRSDLGHTLVWHQIAGFNEAVQDIALHGTMLFLRTSRDAPQQRVIRVAANSPNLDHAETIFPEGNGTIDGMAAAADGLYITRDEGGIKKLFRVDWHSKVESIPLPFEGSIGGMNANSSTPGLLVRMQGWTQSQTVYRYQPDKHAFFDTEIAPKSAVSFEDVASRNFKVPAADGAMIPITVMAKRGAVRSGTHPVLMYAYGSYGLTISPMFNATRRAWLDLGGIYVIAHVRGSGGFGEDWRRAGQLEKKTKSISDFIDVAQYLVHSGWATPEMLSCAGESAGGIVIGGAIAARPDLFSAAVIRAGLVNAMRLERIPIGPFNTGEFGSTKTKAGAQMLYAIDAYQHIKEGTAYPGVLLIVGRNDTRVSPWMSAKLAARLQASNAGPRPVLLQVQDQGGHYSEAREQVESELADIYAFLLGQAGIPDFQPHAALRPN